MLDVLLQAEREVRTLLKDESGWKTLFINYHPPFVERLWRPFGEEYRLFLHCIHPCTEEQALFHPHPWPSAMRVLEGTYWMKIGAGASAEIPPVVCESLVTATQET